MFVYVMRGSGSLPKPKLQPVPKSAYAGVELVHVASPFKHRNS